MSREPFIPRLKIGGFLAPLGKPIATYEVGPQSGNPAGRWPPNLLLSHSIWCTDAACAEGCPIRALDAQSGVRKSGAKGEYPARFTSATYGSTRTHGTLTYEANEGGASRYFATFRYVAKASRKERNAGCEGLPSKSSTVNLRQELQVQNSHPTVKPLALMSWLITLITPPGGLVLDPFAGSGSTCVAARAGGWRYLGIEREAEYVAIANARLNATTYAPVTPAASAKKHPTPLRPHCSTHNHDSTVQQRTLLETPA